VTVLPPTACRANLSKSSGQAEHDTSSQFIGDFSLVTAQRGDTVLISDFRIASELNTRTLVD
jgi:hypothetical protein